MDQNNSSRPSPRNWTAPSDRRIRELALVTAVDIADAIKHLRAKLPDLAQKWGLNARRPERNSRRTRR